MTKEEYLQATSYTSLEEAEKDLRALQTLFPLTLAVLVCSNLIISIGRAIHPSLGTALIIGCLLFGCFFIWKCRDVIQKTRNVTKADLFFSIVLAPLSWIWFYPQLSEPLEIIVGKRMPPTTDVVAEKQMRVEASKKGTRRAIRTILITLGIGLLVVIAINVF